MKHYQAAEFILLWLFQETFSSAYAVLLTMMFANNVKKKKNCCLIEYFFCAKCFYLFSNVIFNMVLHGK